MNHRKIIDYEKHWFRASLKNKYRTKNRTSLCYDKVLLKKVSGRNFVKSQVRSLHMSALNEVFSSLVPLHGQESESVLTVICTK